MIRYSLDLECDKCDADMQVSGAKFEEMEHWTREWRIAHVHHPSKNAPLKIALPKDGDSK